MQKKFILLGTALAATMTFAACQPVQTVQEGSSMESTSPVTSTDTNSGSMYASPMMSGSPTTDATTGVMVGGALMSPLRPIPVNAAAASNLTTLVAAVKQAELVDTLAGPGPYTVFAPTNAAFDKVPKATLDALMTPAKKADLTKILTYHVVAGKYTADQLTDGMKLKTVQGAMLTVSAKNGVVMLVDSKGGKATVETADVLQSNGVVHVIDSVLMP